MELTDIQPRAPHRRGTAFNGNIKLLLHSTPMSAKGLMGRSKSDGGAARGFKTLSPSERILQKAKVLSACPYRGNDHLTMVMILFHLCERRWSWYELIVK